MDKIKEKLSPLLRDKKRSIRIIGDQYEEVRE